MPDVQPPRPLFLDTGALYARFDPADAHHDAAQDVFERIRANDLAFRPLYTSRYVLSELVTLLTRHVSHGAATRALSAVRSSEWIRVLDLTDRLFDRTCEEFERYDDHEISFVDHTSAVLAAEHEIEHVFAFDSDFETLGLRRVPDSL